MAGYCIEHKAYGCCFLINRKVLCKVINKYYVFVVAKIYIPTIDNSQKHVRSYRMLSLTFHPLPPSLSLWGQVFQKLCHDQGIEFKIHTWTTFFLVCFKSFLIRKGDVLQPKYGTTMVVTGYPEKLTISWVQSLLFSMVWRLNGVQWKPLADNKRTSDSCHVWY